MKKSRFTEEQVIYALRLAESGTLVTDVCRQMSISEATFYVWKKKHASLGVTELRQLRQLQDENGRPKRLVGCRLAGRARHDFAASDPPPANGASRLRSSISQKTPLFQII